MGEIMTVGSELPKEMARVRDEVMPAYKAIGNAGAFALHMMRASLDNAAKVMAEGDTIGMLRALEDLRGYHT